VIRGRDPAQRLAIAAATAGGAVFAFSASVEWIWLIPVLPIAMVMLAVVVFLPGSGEPVAQPRLRKPGLRVGARVAAAAAALAVVVAVALPMAATGAIRASQSLAQRDELRQALAQAVDAVNLQPYAATPWVQEALVLEQAGDLPDALIAARHATAHEDTNWQTWFVLCRLEARTGHVHAAIADYLKARSLDPRSPLFNA
jgi:tetratricopeptide (TPR) repeat protein